MWRRFEAQNNSPQSLASGHEPNPFPDSPGLHHLHEFSGKPIASVKHCLPISDACPVPAQEGAEVGSVDGRLWTNSSDGDNSGSDVFSQ